MAPTCNTNRRSCRFSCFPRCFSRHVWRPYTACTSIDGVGSSTRSTSHQQACTSLLSSGAREGYRRQAWEKMSSSQASLNASVSSLRASINLLESSISILDAGVSDFPRLGKVLSTTRVCRMCLCKLSVS